MSPVEVKSNGRAITVRMTVGEAITLREELSRHVVARKTKELRDGLGVFVPEKVVLIRKRQ